MTKIKTLAIALACSLTAFSAEKMSNTTKPESWGDTPFIEYPTTKAIFYGSDINLNKDWNICVGSTDGGVEVHMTQQILPIQNCPGQYVVVRIYTSPDGTILKRSIKRLSDGPVPI